MMRKTYILLLILLLGFSLCLINGSFAEFNEKIKDADFILEDDFEFPMAEGPAYIQGNAEFQRSPDGIIGDPDFEKMRDLPPDSQDYILGTKVGLIAIPLRNNPARFRPWTGFLVGPDLFMTNHHCIHDDEGPLPLENAAILMDYYQEPDVDPTLGGVTAGVLAVVRADALKDYALLRLDKSIGYTYGWLELDTETRVNSSQHVKLISHNRGRSKEIVRRNSQIVDIPAGDPLEGDPFAFLYLADTESGADGSPVFLSDGTGVIGIHHTARTRGGVPVYNTGSLMSYIVPEIEQWLPSQMITFTPSTMPDQTFMVGTSVSLTLPSATDGISPYTYTLSPSLPAGLQFHAPDRWIYGTPTTVTETTRFTYIATDVTGGYAALNFTIEVRAEAAPDLLVDVNGDGQVSVVDLAIVALSYGMRLPAGINLPADVNADGVVDILDITVVAQGIDAAVGHLGGLSLPEIEAALLAAAEQAEDLEDVAAAPNALSGGNLTSHNVAAALAEAKQFAISDMHVKKGIPVVLEKLLQLLTETKAIPETTALLPNYPNPFNPETWIPYHLATDAEVIVTIYDMRGVLVRELTLGHQPAGIYESRGRAAYWDGRNQIGEQVASGVYFYTLTAGDFTTTRKLFIRK